MESKNSVLYVMCEGGKTFTMNTKPRFKGCASGGSTVLDNPWRETGLSEQALSLLLGTEINPSTITMIRQDVTSFGKACGTCFRPT